MTEMALHTTLELDKFLKLEEFQKHLTTVMKLDGVSHSYDLEDRTLVLVVAKPHHLEGAPSGPHSFAEGWLMFENAQRLARQFGTDITWTEVEWDPEYGEVRKVTDKEVVVLK